jgi:hypothetical protein
MYAIQEKYFDIIRDVENNEGELTPDMEKALEINEDEKEAKALAYIQRIDEANGYVDRLTKEIARLTKKKKSQQALVERLKGTLVDSVTLMGEYSTGFYSVGVRTSQAVNILDESKLPAEYVTTEEKTKVDKTAIKRDIKAGTVIDGAEILENKSLSLGTPKK